MIIHAYNTTFNTTDKYEMDELFNRIYDELVDQYDSCGVLITEDALQDEVESIIADMITDKYDYDDEWAQYA